MTHRTGTAVFVNPFLPSGGRDYAIMWLDREISDPSFSAMSEKEAEDYNNGSLFFQGELKPIYQKRAVAAAKRLRVLLE